MIKLPKLFNQYDPKWAHDQHGSSSSTIGKTGCTITLLTAILFQAGYTNETPKTVDDKLTANRGYAYGNLILWTVVPKIWPRLKWIGRYYSYNNEKAKEWISRGMVPMIEVKADPIGGAPGGKHWVGFLGDGASFDPWGGDIEQTKIWTPTGMALYEYTPNTQPITGGNMEIEKQLFEKLVGNSSKWDSLVKYLELPTDPATTPFEDVQRVIAGFKSRVTDLMKQVNGSSTELENRLEQVSRLKDQLLNDLSTQKGLLANEIKARKLAEDNVGVVQDRANELQKQVTDLAKDKGELNTKLGASEMSGKEWQDKYNALLSTGVKANVTPFDAISILLKSFVSWSQSVKITKESSTPTVENS